MKDAWRLTRPAQWSILTFQFMVPVMLTLWMAPARSAEKVTSGRERFILLVLLTPA